jgi:hypothetical protein
MIRPHIANVAEVAIHQVQALIAATPHHYPRRQTKQVLRLEPAAFTPKSGSYPRLAGKEFPSGLAVDAIVVSGLRRIEGRDMLSCNSA